MAIANTNTIAWDPSNHTLVSTGLTGSVITADSRMKESFVHDPYNVNSVEETIIGVQDRIRRERDNINRELEGLKNRIKQIEARRAQVEEISIKIDKLLNYMCGQDEFQEFMTKHIMGKLT